MIQDAEHLFCICYRVRAAWRWTKMRMLELMRDQARPPDVSNMDFIFSMFLKCRQEADMMLILGTFVELVDTKAVMKPKDLLVNTVTEEQVCVHAETSCARDPTSSSMMLPSV